MASPKIVLTPSEPRIKMRDYELAKAWIDEISLNDGVVDPDRAMNYAFILDDHIHDNPEFAWSVIKTISQSQLTNWVSANFSAGPLSSFILYNDLKFLDEIRAFAEQSESFKDHLYGIVFSDRLKNIFGENFKF
jgi:hypothetical protein